MATAHPQPTTALDDDAAPTAAHAHATGAPAHFDEHALLDLFLRSRLDIHYVADHSGMSLPALIQWTTEPHIRDYIDAYQRALQAHASAVALADAPANRAHALHHLRATLDHSTNPIEARRLAERILRYSTLPNALNRADRGSDRGASSTSTIIPGHLNTSEIGRELSDRLEVTRDEVPDDEGGRVPMLPPHHPDSPSLQEEVPPQVPSRVARHQEHGRLRGRAAGVPDPREQDLPDIGPANADRPAEGVQVAGDALVVEDERGCGDQPTRGAGAEVGEPQEAEPDAARAQRPWPVGREEVPRSSADDGQADRACGHDSDDHLPTEVLGPQADGGPWLGPVDVGKVGIIRECIRHGRSLQGTTEMRTSPSHE